MDGFDARALAVLDRLRGAGHQAVLVGGCVRDALLGLAPHDYDAATSALPAQTAAVCAGLRVVETGLKHGTLTVLSDGLPVEVTTFRREGDYSDHRRPDRVFFTDSLEEDLARRDFTVNAMAWDGEALVDPFGGQRDLTARVLRCVGSPERRFREDALRILRALRLSAQLRFCIEEHTAKSLRALSPLLEYVSRERVGAEFFRLLCAPDAGRVLLEFPEVVCTVLPQLAPQVGLDQRNFHHRFDLYTHSVRAVEGVPPRPAPRLAALLHDVGKPSVFTLDEQGVGHFYGHAKAGLPLAAQALDSLRPDGATRKRVLELVELHHLPLGPDEKIIGRRLARLGEELFFDLLALQRADGAASSPAFFDDAYFTRVEATARALLERGNCLSRGDLAVDGHDALAAGLRGAAVGRALDGLLERVSSGELPNDRQTLLQKLAEC